jgi:hypothetical protein
MPRLLIIEDEPAIVDTLGFALALPSALMILTRNVNWRAALPVREAAPTA